MAWRQFRDLAKYIIVIARTVRPMRTHQRMEKFAERGAEIVMGPAKRPYRVMGRPIATQRSKMLLPKALEMPSSELPLMASLMLRNASGMLVAAAATMRAIIGRLRLNSSLINTQASTRKKQPTPTPIRPKTKLM